MKLDLVAVTSPSRSKRGGEGPGAWGKQDGSFGSIDHLSAWAECNVHPPWNRGSQKQSDHDGDSDGDSPRAQPGHEIQHDGV